MLERRLGISIYPNHSEKHKDLAYIDLAASLGYKRVFTCLLSVGDNPEAVKKHFAEIIQHARSKNMDVLFDVSPSVFEAFHLSYDDLSFFKELGATGIRLDGGFDGHRESQLSHNDDDLKIELNMSMSYNFLEHLMPYAPNKNNLLGCHNFYPQRYTGLDHDFFIETSENFKKYNLRTAAFVSCKEGKLGPWNVNDGLCTIEQHRDLTITSQAKALWATDLIDDVIIGNAYASQEELESLIALDPFNLEIDIEVQTPISEIEREILFSHKHTRRGDINSYTIRGTDVRRKYQIADIPVRGYDTQAYGDVFIGNNEFGKYKGEVHVILNEMPNDPRKSRIGRVRKDDLILLQYIGSWTRFKLKEHQ
ncbi:MAG: DUF871 domain-containing protein [Brevinema sp.]